VESGVAVGTHSVEFKSVTGWIKPANSNVSIIENQTATVNGTYAVQGGTVFVDVTPDHAWWSLSGPAGFEGNGTFYSGDWTFNNAPPGSYTWSAQYDLANYDAPGPETKFLSLGGSISFYKAWTQTPPVAHFSATPAQGISPLIVSFTDLSTGTIHTRMWNFGDGETSTEQNPQHIFNNLGLYSVTLDVTGPGGTSRTEGTVIIYKTLYVNKSDETCGGKSPCFTSIQAALGSPEQVKMIKVTQGPYQEEIQNTQNHTAIIQGGNDAAFQSTPSTSSVTKITGTAGALIPENIAVGAQ
jgi:PKD repeat protein